MVSDELLRYLWTSRTRFNRHAEAAEEIERITKQRDELAWAIAWFLKGGSREKLEARFKTYEETL